jgi:hypothetical protein
LWSRDHILGFVAEDLERFVENRLQLGKDRAATNATTFVMFDFWLWNAQPQYHLPHRGGLLHVHINEHSF